MSDNLNLSLGSAGKQAGGDGSGGSGNPVAGWFAVGFGLLGIFGPGFIFVPLAFIASIVSLLMGQFLWAMMGLLLSFAGLVTSPKLWLILGLGFLIHWLRSIGVPVPEGITV